MWLVLSRPLSYKSCGKLVLLKEYHSVSHWMLSVKHQDVMLSNKVSASRILNTGVPQECVLSPLLFTLFTNTCTSDDLVIKFSDDASVTDLTSGDRMVYRGEGVLVTTLV